MNTYRDFLVGLTTEASYWLAWSRPWSVCLIRNRTQGQVLCRRRQVKERPKGRSLWHFSQVKPLNGVQWVNLAAVGEAHTVRKSLGRRKIPEACVEQIMSSELGPTTAEVGTREYGHWCGNIKAEHGPAWAKEASCCLNPGKCFLFSLLGSTARRTPLALMAAVRGWATMLSLCVVWVVLLLSDMGANLHPVLTLLDLFSEVPKDRGLRLHMRSFLIIWSAQATEDFSHLLDAVLTHPGTFADMFKKWKGVLPCYYLRCWMGFKLNCPGSIAKEWLQARCGQW